MKEQDFRIFVDQVKELNDIAEVIGEYIKLDRPLRAICPFHEEKNPSFHLNAQGQYFYCFGCAASGDVITFIMLYRELPFLKALSFLAQRAGLPPPTLKDEDLNKIQRERKMEDILSNTAHYYHNSLPKEVKTYLTNQRMITDETIETFLIGYANGGLKKYLIDTRKYSLEDCLQAGVLSNEGGSSTHDFFYHRITLPSFKYGRIINLSGRIFPEGDPKYLHLRGRPISLYNQDALRSKEVIITEGIFDCLTAVQHEYSAVALQGAKNFKDEYLPLFQKVETAYICLDGDEAGRLGARAIGKLLEDKARIVLLPDGKDLDEYLKENGRDKFQELLSSSLDPIEYEILLIHQDTKPLNLSIQLTSVFKQRISKRPRTQQESFLKLIKKRFKFRDEEVQEYRRLLRTEEKKVSDEKLQPKIKRKYLGTVPGLVDLIEHEGQPGYFLKEGQEYFIKTSIQIEGETFYPPPKDQLGFLLPNGQRVISIIHDSRETDQRLYKDLLELFKRNAELPSEDHYHLCCLWVFHTYLLENFNYSPQLCFFALDTRGKTRIGKSLIYTAYRGTLTEEVREAIIIRMSEDLNASFFFDLWNIWKTANESGSVDLLLQRFERGARVFRVLFPERESFEDYRAFKIFGPTVFATNEPSHRIMESRGIVISMPQSERTFEGDVRPEDLLTYKERLVAFRARHLGQYLPYSDKPSSGRLGDIMKPLYQVLKLICPEREEPFFQFLREIEEERKMVKSQTTEAEIIEALIELEPNVIGGTLPIKEITEKLNEDRKERFQYSPETIGRKLRVMGFKGKRLSGRLRAIIYDKEKIGALAYEHGIFPSLPSQPSQKTLFEA